MLHLSSSNKSTRSHRIKTNKAKVNHSVRSSKMSTNQSWLAGNKYNDISSDMCHSAWTNGVTLWEFKHEVSQSETCQQLLGDGWHCDKWLGERCEVENWHTLCIKVLCRPQVKPAAAGLYLISSFSNYTLNAQLARSMHYYILTDNLSFCHFRSQWSWIQTGELKLGWDIML